MAVLHTVWWCGRYFVPNPASGGKRQQRKSGSGGGGASSSKGNKATAAVKANTATEEDSSLGAAIRHASTSDGGESVRVSVVEGSDNYNAAAAAAAAAAAGGGEVPAELELLKGISCFACPGNLLALMGGSGEAHQGCYCGGGMSCLGFLVIDGYRGADTACLYGCDCCML